MAQPLSSSACQFFLDQGGPDETWGKRSHCHARPRETLLHGRSVPFRRPRSSSARRKGDGGRLQVPKRCHSHGILAKKVRVRQGRHPPTIPKPAMSHSNPSEALRLRSRVDFSGRARLPMASGPRWRPFARYRMMGGGGGGGADGEMGKGCSESSEACHAVAHCFVKLGVQALFPPASFLPF